MKIKFGILHKLILGFLIPVIFIIILGFISYSKSSEGLISNYKKATTNTITMATRYLEFSMDTVNNISLQYTKDSDTSYFTRGLIYTEAQERLNFVTTANNKLLAKADMEKFVANIHIIPGQDIPVLTSDMENMTGFYPELLEAEEGKKLKNAKTESYWMGEHPLIDSKFGLKAADYAFSFLRKFTGGSSVEGNACIVIDVSAQEVETSCKPLI